MKTNSTFRFRIVLLLQALVAVCASGLLFCCGLSSSKVRNVILISIDTCRADHLSCYGYSRVTTPNIDKLAQESFLFTNAYSPAPITLSAHSSMLTGTIPPYHGVHDNLDYKLGQSNETLAEILGRNGFTTGAIISAFVMDSLFGLNQGFDYYSDRFEKIFKTPGFNERKGEETTHLALEWLDKHKSERFFLFLHYFDPHRGYEPPEPFATRFRDNLYAGEIAYVDSCIGKLIQKLKELGLYKSALIVITSDHGEMLGDHGENTHGYFIYQPAIRVPLIFKLPGRHKARMIDDPVGIVDIVPTVSKMLGIERQTHIQGKDLSFYFEKGKPSVQERHLYCGSQGPTRYDANSLMGVITARWKYIQTTRPELYDLFEDPGEISNLAKQQPQRAKILKDRLRQILEESVRKDSPDSKAALDEEGRKRLESLGYIADGRVREDFEFDQDKEDPKDLIGLHMVNVKAHGFNNLGYVLAEQGKLNEAMVNYFEALRIKPDFAEAHNNIGSALVVQGKSDEAVGHFSEAVRINPDFEKAHINLGHVFFERGNLDKAFAHFSEALRIKPDYGEAHNGMGAVLTNQGRIDEAIKHFSEAVRIKPGYVKALRNLAWILATQENPAFRNGPKAVEHAERACKITGSKHPLLLDTLAAAYAEAGMFDEARLTAEKAIELAQSAGRAEWARGIEKRLKLYKAGNPYHEGR